MKQIIMLLLTVASTMQADNKSDSDYIRKLIGEWQQTEKIGPMSVMTDYSYKKDGTLDSFATITCLLYTSPSPRDATLSRMPSSA